MNQVCPFLVVSQVFQIHPLSFSQHWEENHCLRCVHCPDTFATEGGRTQVRPSIIVLEGGDEI